MPEELYYLFLGIGIGVPAILTVTILLNPDFWQGLRNSKFLDDMHKLDDPLCIEHDKDAQ